MGYLPSRIWECEYKHDRRNHRHRCKACNHILNEGEPAIMARFVQLRGRSKVRAIHASCGDTRHSEQYSWREAMKYWSEQIVDRGYINHPSTPFLRSA